MSSDDDDNDLGYGPNDDKNKKRRIQRACDTCRRKKSASPSSPYFLSRSSPPPAFSLVRCSWPSYPTSHSILTPRYRRWKPDGRQPLHKLHHLESRLYLRRGRKGQPLVLPAAYQSTHSLPETRPSQRVCLLPAIAACLTD